MKAENKNGITLIALIITIILMLILAGVVISLTIGENGLFINAKKGKEKYKEASVKEKVEIALLDYNSNKLIKGEEGEIQDALKTLLENKTFEEIEDNIGLIDDYEITLGKENGKIIITEIGQSKITYTLSTENYTKDPITITIIATGIVELLDPDSVEIPVIDGKAETTYVVNKNGTYVFTAKDTNGNEKKKGIVIDKIDTLPPKSFSIEVEKIAEDGIKIKAQAEDDEATTESTCSGINRYEYYISNDGTNYEKYETDSITGIDINTCYIYVKAYDKVENFTQSETIKIFNGKMPYYIFYYGEQFKEVTGGWARTGYHVNSGQVTIKDNYIYLKGATNSSRAYAGIAKKINFSQYSKMIITYSGQGEYEFSNVSYYNNSYDNYRVAIAYSTKGEKVISLDGVGEKFFHFTNSANNRIIHLCDCTILNNYKNTI